LESLDSKRLKLVAKPSSATANSNLGNGKSMGETERSGGVN